MFKEANHYEPDANKARNDRKRSRSDSRNRHRQRDSESMFIYYTLYSA